MAVLLLAYAALIIFYYKNWLHMPQPACGAPFSGVATFSILIPARNEAANILQLLQSIAQLSYPLQQFEVIVINDQSEDNTAAIVLDFFKKNREINGRLLHTTPAANAHKKKAIEQGVNAANNEWIVCTDADCVVPRGWLTAYANSIANGQPVFIAAPVTFLPAKNKGIAAKVLYLFQVLDFMTLQGITAASVHTKKHTMCNGANLAYKKEVFAEVGGFTGIDSIASGDDMLLMHKIWQRYPDEVVYIKDKNAIVETAAAPTWRVFINQRIRWASKAKYYDDKRIFWVLILVYFLNVAMLFLGVASFFSINIFYAFLIFLLLKTIAEYPFIISISKFFSRKKTTAWFIFFQPLHIVYTVLSGFLGSFGKYEWKGRRVE